MLKTPNWHIAEEGATAFLSLVILLYLTSSLFTIAYLLKIAFEIDKTMFFIIGGVISLLIYYLNYSHFHKKKKYLEVISEFKTENNIQKLVGNVFVFLLTLGSILSVIFFGILLNSNR